MFNREALDDIRENLLYHKETIAVAQSVTWGFLQAAFSSVPDAATFFQVGITAYNLGQTYRHLLVNPVHANDCNCVSEGVAATMSLEVCRLFSSHLGIGSTAYATKMPEGGNELHVFYATIHNGELPEENIFRASTEEGVETQLYFVNEVLKALRKKTEVATSKHSSV